MLKNKKILIAILAIAFAAPLTYLFAIHLRGVYLLIFNILKNALRILNF